jgi:hypothetical protein
MLVSTLSGVITFAGILVVILYLGGAAHAAVVKLATISPVMAMMANDFIFMIFSPFVFSEKISNPSSRVFNA